jgi:endoribonuclease Dicer
MSDSEDDDAYRLTRNSPKAPRTSEKKRIDAVNFQTWISQNQREITTTKSTPNGESARDSSTGERIIESPREYQIDLFERAKEKNIIVVLDTGMEGRVLWVASDQNS